MNLINRMSLNMNTKSSEICVVLCVHIHKCMSNACLILSWQAW
uniref:Uncharacterized protein n=1 Tax=Arundo donax TaxID=35708 RepID=A0A0A9C586_ARUDO